MCSTVAVGEKDSVTPFVVGSEVAAVSAVEIGDALSADGVATGVRSITGTGVEVGGSKPPTSEARKVGSVSAGTIRHATATTLMVQIIKSKPAIALKIMVLFFNCISKTSREQ